MANVREKKMVKSSKDLFEEASRLQEQLRVMYADREKRGYKSEYKLNDIKELEIKVNSINDELLREEYVKTEFLKLLDSQSKILSYNKSKEEELLVELEKVRKNIRLAELRVNSLTDIINDNEGDDFITKIESKSILDEMDITDFNMDLFCKEFSIENPNIPVDDFVLKMFSYFKGSEAFKHYSDEDIALLFRRNFVVEGKRLSFPNIKELYYADGKTVDSYTKQYKIVRDKFRKHIKVRPDDLVF